MLDFESNCKKCVKTRGKEGHQKDVSFLFATFQNDQGVFYRDNEILKHSTISPKRPLVSVLTYDNSFCFYFVARPTKFVIGWFPSTVDNTSKR